MKRWCWNCENDTKHITKHVKYGGDDDLPNIMYTREFYCTKCGEGYYLKWYFRSTILRKMNKKRRIKNNMKHIDRDFENCTCCCDYCNYDELIDSTNYGHINKELKSYGWLIKKIDDEWKEFCCDECYEKYMQERKNKQVRKVR